MHLFSLLPSITNEPETYLLFLLISGVIIVNGWTDAPTAIATCISSRTLTPKKAVILAAVMNFFGVFIMSRLSGKVVSSITNIAEFDCDRKTVTLALCASLISIIIWAVTAWFFGIPTSESHALVASVSGAAIAVTKSFMSINKAEWLKVICGLFISAVLGFILGFLIVKAVGIAIRNSDRIKTDKIFIHLQNLSAAFMAFMHGAQDGQKFIGIFIIFTSAASDKTNSDIPVFLIIYTSLLMAFGTSAGGMRIIKAMGSDMVKLKKYQGFSADLAGAISLLISTVSGFPVSTTHTKTTAIMGVGAEKRLSSVNWKIAKEMLATWIFTFPACGLLSYILTAILLGLR